MDAEDMEDVQAPTAVQVLVSILLKQAVNSVNQKYFKMCPRKQKSYNEPPLQAKEQYCSYPYKALNNYSIRQQFSLYYEDFIAVRPRVAIIMGSQTDLPVMKVVERVSKEFNIPSNYYFCTLNHIADDVEILRRV
uniref:Uncharacterized protein n=1 Tax=Zea mays TaxID=4577 RepID=A0A804PCI6_MAIZE